jgi:hypothetical protein
MKTLNYEPGFGTHILDACKGAVEMAKREGANVLFSFNEIELVAAPHVAPEEIVAAFRALTQKRYDEHKASPEGQREAQDRAEEIERKQTIHDLMVRRLRLTIQRSQDEILRWVRDFQEVSDDIGVKTDFPAVIALFEAAGYQANENTGLPRDHYNARPIMARYIIGQAIACMKSGMPPHQITHTFVEKYFASR